MRSIEQLMRLSARSKGKHQDRFDENNDAINNLLEEKYRIQNNKSHANQAAYNNIRSSVQQRQRQMQDSWLKKKAEEIQNYPDKNDMKRFYDAIKTVHGPQPASSSPFTECGWTKAADREGPHS